MQLTPEQSRTLADLIQPVASVDVRQQVIRAIPTAATFADLASLIPGQVVKEWHFSDAEARDDHGRWLGGGSSGTAAAASKTDGLPAPTITETGPLASGERMSVDGYMSPAGNRVYQDDLRAGTADTRPDSAVSDLDNAIAKGRIDNNSVVYRGLAAPPDFGGFKQGATFSDKAYTSVTTDLDTARAFAELRATGSTRLRGVEMSDPFFKPTGQEQRVLAIRLQPGQHAIRGDRSVGELVLPRGMTYRVTGIRSDGVVEAEVA